MSKTYYKFKQPYTVFIFSKFETIIPFTKYKEFKLKKQVFRRKYQKKASVITKAFLMNM